MTIKISRLLEFSFMAAILLLMCVLAYYVITHIQVLQTNPCKACEQLGYMCARSAWVTP